MRPHVLACLRPRDPKRGLLTACTGGSRGYGKVISTGVLAVSSTSTTFSDKMGLKSPEGDREVFSKKWLSS